jgi:hypothetical protein
VFLAIFHGLSNLDSDDFIFILDEWDCSLTKSPDLQRMKPTAKLLYFPDLGQQANLTYNVEIKGISYTLSMLALLYQIALFS